MSVEPVEQRLPRDLFEPFGDDHAPTGLTLPLVKRLVENQGGRITAARDSERLEFVIQLPMTHDTAAVQPFATLAS
jgi:nitrogen-specific signal transduction histidine kinase